MNKKILYSGMRFVEHKNGSGYDAIAKNSDSHVSSENVPGFFKYHYSSKFFKLTQIYVELLTALKLINYDVVHYYYAESTMLFSAFFAKMLNKKVIVTVHLDEERVLRGKNMPRSTYWLTVKNIKKCDAMIVLSESQRKYFSGILTCPVHFVPHGFLFDNNFIDEEMAVKRKKNKRIVVVGSNYRDFDLLEEVVPILHMYVFDVVGAPIDKKEKLKKYANVVVHDRLSDCDYDSVLMGALAMFLPLKFATANNAILEAYNLCLPVVTTNVEGVHDYAISESAFANSGEDLLRYIDIISNLSLQNYIELCLKIKNKAVKKFDWSEVRNDISKKVYI